MRHTQNKRRFYWLPLLCVILTVPASAQWTTVWTPDSAPAAKNISQDDKHDSDPTKCYPCKVWDKGANSGRGGWVNLSADTKPIQCKGDTNDYACKVCNGLGEPTKNKDDRSDCQVQMVLLEPGKCCEGECLPIPQPGIDPCNWALDNKNLMSPTDQNKLKRGSRTMGYILCVFGEKHACTVPYNFPSSWGPDMKDCIMKEEINHLGSATAQCPPCIGMATYPDAATKNDEECIARAATFDCMGGLTNGASSWYQQTIKDVQKGIWIDMKNMGCPNLPPEPS